MNRLVQRLLNESRPSSGFLDNRLRRRLGLIEKENIGKEEWDKRVESQNIDKELMNDLVMDYLSIECSKEAVDHFKVEANCKANPGKLLEYREAARQHFLKNEINEVFKILQNENPNIIEENPKLILDLKLVHLIGICEKQNGQEAVKYVRDQIMPNVKQKEKVREIIEKILLLLIFEDPESYPHFEMIGNLREETLVRVNQELISNHSDMLEPKLVKIFKVMKWMENKLGEKIDFPRMKNLDGDYSEIESSHIAGVDEEYSSVSSYES